MCILFHGHYSFWKDSCSCVSFELSKSWTWCWNGMLKAGNYANTKILNVLKQFKRSLLSILWSEKCLKWVVQEKLVHLTLSASMATRICCCSCFLCIASLLVMHSFLDVGRSVLFLLFSDLSRAEYACVVEMKHTLWKIIKLFRIFLFYSIILEDVTNLLECNFNFDYDWNWGGLDGYFS